MKHLLKEFSRLKPRLLKHRIFLVLDFDGTLSPIAHHPKAAVMPAATQKILTLISRNKKFQVSIISGRSIADLKKRIGLKELVYAGNHGLELEGPGIRLFKSAGKEARRNMSRIFKELSLSFKRFYGIYIEHKGCTLSIHYRNVPADKVRTAKKKLAHVLNSCLEKWKIKITEGKKVWEIRPPVNWNKGSAVKWMLSRMKQPGHAILPVVIGDDTTDEDAFKAIGRSGLSVKVISGAGKKHKTYARYYLKSPREVLEFLKMLIAFFPLPLLREGEGK